MTILREVLAALPRRKLAALPSIAVLPLFTLLQGCPVWTGDSRPIYTACASSFDCPIGYACDLDLGCVEADSGFPTRDAGIPTTIGDAGVTFDAGDFPRSCRVDGDCPSGQLCDPVDLVCAPSTPCTTDAMCAANFWCDFRDTCVPKADGCRTALDCDSSELCIEGACQTVDSTCQLNTSCALGLCANNECTLVCTSDSQCSPGDSCIDNFCQAPTNECSESSTCAANERCVGGRCLIDCSVDNRCPSGTYCDASDGFCHPDWEPRPFCPATPCQTGRECLDGVCRTPCTTDSDCRMFDSQLPFCVDVMVTTGTRKLCVDSMTAQEQCRTQSDCPTNQDCVGGACRSR